MCKEHGRQGFQEMCEHIWRDYQNGIVPEIKNLPILMTKICNNCYSKHNIVEIQNITFDLILELSEEDQDMIFDKISSIYDKISRKIECIKCIDKLVASTIKNVSCI